MFIVLPRAGGAHEPQPKDHGDRQINRQRDRFYLADIQTECCGSLHKAQDIENMADSERQDAKDHIPGFRDNQPSHKEIAQETAGHSQEDEQAEAGQRRTGCPCAPPHESSDYQRH